MDYKDYYKTLGLSRDAEAQDIKKAFRSMARKYHPDVNPDDKNAEERFKEINEAYEVLSDPEKRARYDQLGSEWSRWQQSGNRPEDFDWNSWVSAGGQGPRVNFGQGTPQDLQDLLGDDVFSSFFQQLFGARGAPSARGRDPFGGFAGGGSSGSRSYRGQDYRHKVEITLHEAYAGTKRLVNVNGRRLEVNIPAGSDTGTQVRIPKAGAPGMMGGESGDLYLEIEVLPDSRFERKEDDLYTSVSVDLYTAILGGEVPVDLLDGKSVLLTIKPETQNGHKLRLRGKGMPHLNKPKQHGDLYVEMLVELPTGLSSRERELFVELKGLRS